MARPPKGKPLTLRPIRLDDDVWAECQRLGKEHGTINEGLRARLLARSGRGVIPMVIEPVHAEVKGSRIEDDSIVLTVREKPLATQRKNKAPLLKPSEKNK